MNTLPRLSRDAGVASLGGASPDRETSGDSGKSIRIGATLPLTGPLQRFGTTLETGYRQALDEVNGDGGILIDGLVCRLELIVLDNASEEEAAGVQAHELIFEHGVAALLGPATPPLSVPVSIAAERAGVPALMTITPLQAWKGGNPDGWEWAWAVFFDEAQMTETQFRTADLVDTNKKVALFTDQEEDGIVMGGLWSDKASDFDYEIVYQAQFPVGNADFSAQVSEARAADADIVIAQVIAPDGIALLKEFESQSYVPELVFLEKAGNTGGYPALSEGLAEGTLAANWFGQGWGPEREQEFVDAYAHELGGINSDLGTIVYGYSITKVLVDSIRAAGSLEPAAINEAIGRTDTIYPAGRIRFGDDHTSATTAVQTQWAGNDAVMVLDSAGRAAAELRTPSAGLRAAVRQKAGSHD